MISRLEIVGPFWNAPADILRPMFLLAAIKFCGHPRTLFRGPFLSGNNSNFLLNMAIVKQGTFAQVGHLTTKAPGADHFSILYGGGAITAAAAAAAVPPKIYCNLLVLKFAERKAVWFAPCEFMAVWFGADVVNLWAFFGFHEEVRAILISVYKKYLIFYFSYMGHYYSKWGNKKLGFHQRNLNVLTYSSINDHKQIMHYKVRHMLNRKLALIFKSTCAQQFLFYHLSVTAGVFCF